MKPEHLAEFRRRLEEELLNCRPKDHAWAAAWLNVGLKIGEQMDEAADAERERRAKRKRSAA